MKKHQSISSYYKWLDIQVALFHKSRKSIPHKPLEIIKDSRYDFVPLHKRPELIQECCQLINSEWKRSETARLASLAKSCEKFPTSFLLLLKDKLIGHCKVSSIHTISDCVVIESFIIDKLFRSQGFGSMLLRAVEDYVHKKGIRNIYLMTRGQEEFYSKNGYTVCDPTDQINRYTDLIENESKSVENTEGTVLVGPPPPPMPTDLFRQSSHINLLPDRVYMKKKLEP